MGPASKPATAFAGSIDQSPWATVGPRREDSLHNDHHMNNINPASDPTTPARNQTRYHPQRETSCGARVLRGIIQAWLVVDFLVGLMLVVYSAWLQEERSVAGKGADPEPSDDSSPPHTLPPRLLITVTLVTGSLLLIRSGTGWMGLLLVDHPCRQFLFGTSTVLSLVVSFLDFGLSSVSWMKRRTIRNLLEQSWAFSSFLKVVHDAIAFHYHYVWMILLGLAFGECLRYLVFEKYFSVAVRYEDWEEDAPSATDTVPHTPRSLRRLRRPWWWSSTSQLEDDSDGLRQSLLSPGVPRWVSNRQDGEYDETTGVTPPRRRAKRSWLAFWKSSSRENLRDDGSVDFASVQEEWASRAEEDPFWWSRDDTETALHSVDRPRRDPDTSWIHEEEK